MAKGVRVGGVQPGTQQVGDAVERVERVGTIAPIPTEPVEAGRTPEENQFREFLGLEPVDAAVASELAAGVEEARAPTPDLEQQQRERERVAPLSERAGIGSIPFGEVDDKAIEANPYLGSVARADRLQNVFDSAAPGPTIGATLTGRVPEEEGRKRIDALNEGDTAAAFKDLELTASRVLNDPAMLDATVQDPNTGHRKVDPGFVRVMGLATEAFLVDSGSVGGVDFEEVFTGVDVDTTDVGTLNEATKKAKGNARLGRAIWQEWQREKNVAQGLPSDSYIDATPPAGQTNEFIGAMAKEAYAMANPDIVERVQAGSQVQFQLKDPETLRAAQQGQANPFQNVEVVPLNAPSATSQPQFEGRTYTRPEVTKLRKQDAGKLDVLEESRQNYHEMGKVIDPRRMKIFMQMALPALRAMSAPAGERQPSPWADMVDIGKARYDSIAGEQARLSSLAEAYAQKANGATGSAATRYAKMAESYAARAQEYDVESVFQSELVKMIEALNTAGRYNNQVNYVTYAFQMLTGRQHIQQNRFNPQASKALRFIIGHGDRTTIQRGRGDVFERNFKEIASIHLGLGGKTLQPEARIAAFDSFMRTEGAQRFAEMGRDLKANLLDNDTAEGIVADLAAMDASQGVQMPASAQLQPMPLKQETQKFLEEHGSEAPYIAEFLMDFADYVEGKPFHTALEVEMDGITHGISSNGVALGVQSMAERAGVIQYGDTQKLLTEQGQQGDIRQAMKDYMMGEAYTKAENEGWADQAPTIAAIVEEAVKDRENYLKKSPMTLAYGQEVENLRQHVEAAVFTGPSAKKIKEIADGAGITLDDATTFLHSMLVDSLHAALDSRVLEMGRLLRANNTVAMMTNEVITIQSPAGFDQFIGARAGTGESTTSPLSYTDPEGKRKDISVRHYEQEASGSAPRARIDPVTGETKFTPGGWGRGRIIPAAIQGYDGNMIARTGSGQSFKRIKSIAKSRGQSGNFQPIFDAFKVSVGMMDVVRAEANKNWINGIKGTDYFANVDEWSRNAYRQFEKDMRELPPNSQVDIQGQYRGIGWLLDYKNLVSHLNSTIEPSEYYERNPRRGRDGKELTQAQATAQDILKEAGIRYNQPIPETMTPAEVIRATRAIMKGLDLDKRNKSMASTVDRERKKLFSKIIPQKVLQVDLG